MSRLPAKSGLQWIRDGFALLRRQPNELSLLFLLYISVNLFISVVPLLGSMLMLIANPVLTTAFMLACAEIDAGGRAHPRHLFAYLRGPAFKRLAGLGLCYLVAFFLASLAMYLFAGNSLVEVLLKANNGEVGADPAAQETVLQALGLGSAIYLVLVFPLWFAGPLIAWQGMGVGKAIFFSFFSVLRAIKAFIAYIVAWILITLFVMANLMALLSLLQFGGNALALAILIPCMIILALVRYCTYYPSYVELFGKPQLAPKT